MCFAHFPSLIIILTRAHQIAIIFFSLHFVLQIIPAYEGFCISTFFGVFLFICYMTYVCFSLSSFRLRFYLLGFVVVADETEFAAIINALLTAQAFVLM